MSQAFILLHYNDILLIFSSVALRFSELISRGVTFSLVYCQPAQNDIEHDNI